MLKTLSDLVYDDLDTIFVNFNSIPSPQIIYLIAAVYKQQVPFLHFELIKTDDSMKVYERLKPFIERSRHNEAPIVAQFIVENGLRRNTSLHFFAMHAEFCKGKVKLFVADHANGFETSFHKMREAILRDRVELEFYVAGSNHTIGNSDTKLKLQIDYFSCLFFSIDALNSLKSMPNFFDEIRESADKNGQIEWLDLPPQLVWNAQSISFIWKYIENLRKQTEAKSLVSQETPLVGTGTASATEKALPESSAVIDKSAQNSSEIESPAPIVQISLSPLIEVPKGFSTSFVEYLRRGIVKENRPSVLKGNTDVVQKEVKLDAAKAKSDIKNDSIRRNTAWDLACKSALFIQDVKEEDLADIIYGAHFPSVCAVTKTLIENWPELPHPFIELLYQKAEILENLLRNKNFKLTLLLSDKNIQKLVHLNFISAVDFFNLCVKNDVLEADVVNNISKNLAMCAALISLLRHGSVSLSSEMVGKILKHNITWKILADPTIYQLLYDHHLTIQDALSIIPIKIDKRALESFTTPMDKVQYLTGPICSPNNPKNKTPSIANLAASMQSVLNPEVPRVESTDSVQQRFDVEEKRETTLLSS